MALLTAMLVGAAVVGAGAAVAGVQSQKKSAKETKAAMAKQENAAREAARLDNTRADSGAEIKLGRDGEAATAEADATAAVSGPVIPSGTVGATTGGLNIATKPEKRPGLLKKRSISSALGL